MRRGEAVHYRKKLTGGRRLEVGLGQDRRVAGWVRARGADRFLAFVLNRQRDVLSMQRIEQQVQRALNQS
jgi:hypothetical protein